MGRKKQSGAEDVIEIVSSFHWGIGVVLAISSYLILHWYAGREITVNAGIENLSKNTFNSLFHVFASFGQIVLPFLFGLGAFISLFNRKKRKKLYEDTRVSTATNPLDDTSWSDFELLVGEHFKRQGYKVQETTGGADGGIDLLLEKSGEKYFVQCKQWKAYKVGVKIIRELLGVMVGGGATGGFVVTSGQFTIDALRFAQENNITLLDGGKLQQIISSGSVPRIKSPKSTAPVCPKCGNEMVKRLAKKGEKAGEQFWGCSEFPKCRSILPYK
jgi:restriction system protein